MYKSENVNSDIFFKKEKLVSKKKLWCDSLVGVKADRRGRMRASQDYNCLKCSGGWCLAYNQSAENGCQIRKGVPREVKTRS